MIRIFREKGLVVPLLFTVAGLIILVLLGNWQMQRRAFKAALIEKVEARLVMAPLSFDEAKKQAGAGGDFEYLPVQLQGRFLNDQERHYFLPLDGKVGWRILTPLQTKNGDILIVDRGFVPDKLKNRQSRAEGIVEGPVQFTGLMRSFETPGFFTPENEPGKNVWYWRDGAALYGLLPGYQGPRFEFMIDARADAQYGTWPKAGVTRVKFSDKHLGYALTWYGLALTLIGVFLAFAIVRLRS